MNLLRLSGKEIMAEGAEYIGDVYINTNYIASVASVDRDGIKYTVLESPSGGTTKLSTPIDEILRRIREISDDVVLPEAGYDV